jgi:hypothetical protein
LRAVPIENADFVVKVGLMSKFLSSGYSLVYVPHEIRRKYGENKPAELYLFSSAYVDQNTAGWLPRFLAHMALMQPISAEIRATASPEFLGGKPAYASGEKSASISDILLAAETILVPAGKNDSKWIGSEEFRQFVTEYANSDACFGSGDDKGMTLETPCGGESAFISFRTDQRHPQLGSGLLIYTHVRACLAFDKACLEAAGLNFFEAVMWTGFPQLGCWHPEKMTGNETDLAHSCFIPNALFAPGLVAYLALWSVARVQWVHQRVFGDRNDTTAGDHIVSPATAPEPPPL